MVAPICLTAQDTVHLNSGEKYKGKVEEIRPTEIVLKSAGGPTRIILKSKIKVIVYENGEIETFEKSDDIKKTKRNREKKNLLSGVSVFANLSPVSQSIKVIDEYVDVAKDIFTDAQNFYVNGTGYKDMAIIYEIRKRLGQKYAIGFESQEFPSTSANIYARRIWEDTDDYGYLFREDITNIQYSNLLFNIYYYPRFGFLGEFFVALGYGKSYAGISYEYFFDSTDWTIWPAELWATEFVIDNAYFYGESNAYQLFTGWEYPLWKGITVSASLKYIQSYKGELDGSYLLSMTTGIGSETSPYNYYYESFDNEPFTDSNGDPMKFDFSLFIYSFGIGYTF
jgi:hypothetical protein